MASTSGQQQALSRRKPSPPSPSPPSSASPLRAPPPSARKPIPEFPFYQQNWFIALLFVMAMGFFSLALFLFLSVDSDSGYTSASAAAASGKEGVEVCVYTLNRFSVSSCVWFEFGNSLWCIDHVWKCDEADAREDKGSTAFSRCALWIRQWSAVSHWLSWRRWFQQLLGTLLLLHKKIILFQVLEQNIN